MTTTKRCEVCEKPECEVGENCVKGFEHPALQCHGHSSPPPRPDEIEKELEKLLGEGADEMPGHHTDCSYRPDFKKKLKSLLLSYGKEREKELFRKCREAVEKAKGEALKLPMGADGGWNQVSHGLLKSLSALDSVRP